MKKKRITAMVTAMTLTCCMFSSGFSGSFTVMAEEDLSVEAPFGSVAITGFLDAEGNPTTLEDIQAAADPGTMGYEWTFSAEDLKEAAGLSGSVSRFSFGVYASGTEAGGETFEDARITYNTVYMDDSAVTVGEGGMYVYTATAPIQADSSRAEKYGSIWSIAPSDTVKFIVQAEDDQASGLKAQYTAPLTDFDSTKQYPLEPIEKMTNPGVPSEFAVRLVSSDEDAVTFEIAYPVRKAGGSSEGHYVDIEAYWRYMDSSSSEGTLLIYDTYEYPYTVKSVSPQEMPNALERWSLKPTDEIHIATEQFKFSENFDPSAEYGMLLPVGATGTISVSLEGVYDPNYYQTTDESGPILIDLSQEPSSDWTYSSAQSEQPSAEKYPVTVQEVYDGSAKANVTECEIGDTLTITAENVRDDFVMTGATVNDKFYYTEDGAVLDLTVTEEVLNGANAIDVTPKFETSYPVVVKEAKGGTVTADKPWLKTFEDLALGVSCDAGFVLKSITVGGKVIDCSGAVKGGTVKFNGTTNYLDDARTWCFLPEFVADSQAFPVTYDTSLTDGELFGAEYAFLGDEFMVNGFGKSDTMHLKSVTVNGKTYPADGKTAQLTVDENLLNGKKALNVSGTFAEAWYMLFDVAKDANGTVTTEPGFVFKGDTAVIQSKPGKGYQLEAVEVNGKKYTSTDGKTCKLPITEKLVGDDGQITVKPVFAESAAEPAEKEYTVAVQENTDFTLIPLTDTVWQSSKTLQFRCKPKTGARFITTYQSSSKRGKTYSVNVTPVLNGLRLNGVFKNFIRVVQKNPLNAPPLFMLAKAADEEFIIEVELTEDMFDEETGTLTIEPVVADAYEYVVEESDGGTAAVTLPDKKTNFLVGDTITVTPEAEEGYCLESLYINGNLIEATDDGYTLKVTEELLGGDEALVISPNFVKLYTLQISNTDAEGGTITADKETVSLGDTVTVTADPDKDFEFTGVMIGSKFYSADDDTTLALTLTEDILGDADTVVLKPVFEKAEDPTEEPTEKPGKEDPAEEPTEEPTDEPNTDPTEKPADEPNTDPTEEPADEPTTDPTEDPGSNDPTETPSDQPTEEPTEAPIDEPTEEPTLPQTGNNAAAQLWLTLGAFELIGLGAAAVAVSRKRRKENQDH